MLLDVGSISDLHLTCICEGEGSRVAVVTSQHTHRSNAEGPQMNGRMIRLTGMIGELSVVLESGLMVPAH